MRRSTSARPVVSLGRFALIGLVAALPASVVSTSAHAATVEPASAKTPSELVSRPVELAPFAVKATDHGGPERRILAADVRANRWMTRHHPSRYVVPAPRASRSAQRVALVPAAAPVAAAVLPASGHGGAILNEAAKYAGVPYVYGGASSSGMDCSGFTMVVFGALGISLPHNAASQYYALPHVDVSAVQPGDLIFLDGLGHVGIYAGNGMMWDAPVPGQSVGLHAIYGSFVAARA